MTKQELQRILDAVGPLEFLRLHWRRKYGGQGNAAKALGCSSSFLYLVAKGIKKPNSEILVDAGLKRIVTETWEVIE